MPVPATLPVNKFGGPALRIGNIIIPEELDGNLTLSADGSEYLGIQTDGGGPYTVTLPPAADCAGQIRQIANVGTNTFEVDGFTGGPIDLEPRGAVASPTKVWSATFACDGNPDGPTWFLIDWATSA